MTQPNNNGQAVNVNPIDCARNTLNFLSRAAFTRNERFAFDQCEAMMTAIIDGQLVLSQAPQPAAPPVLEDVQKKARPRKTNGDARAHAPEQTDALG